MVTAGDLWLRECAVRAAKSQRAVTGRFIPAEDVPRAVHEAREAGVLAAFDGGREGAERLQVCFYPEGEEPAFDLQWVRIGWNARFSAPDHRDLLGSLMALGTDRSWMGDLVTADGCAYLCAMPVFAARLPAEWREAGRTALRVSLMDTPPQLESPEGTAVSGTVASLRLDCLLAEALRLSRAQAAERIRRGDVSVGHHPEERVDRLIAPGEIISVRGTGRVILREAGAPNRKGRLPVRLALFVRDR